MRKQSAWWRAFPLAICFALVLVRTTGGAVAQEAKARAPSDISIGQAPVVILKRPRSADRDKPQFLELIAMPGRGMAWLQLKAFVPGRGDINLLYAPPLAQAQN